MKFSSNYEICNKRSDVIRFIGETSFTPYIPADYSAFVDGVPMNSYTSKIAFIRNAIAIAKQEKRIDEKARKEEARKEEARRAYYQKRHEEQERLKPKPRKITLAEQWALAENAHTEHVARVEKGKAVAKAFKQKKLMRTFKKVSVPAFNASDEELNTFANDIAISAYRGKLAGASMRDMAKSFYSSEKEECVSAGRYAIIPCIRRAQSLVYNRGANSDKVVSCLRQLAMREMGRMETCYKSIAARCPEGAIIPCLAEKTPLVTLDDVHKIAVKTVKAWGEETISKNGKRAFLKCIDCIYYNVPFTVTNAYGKQIGKRDSRKVYNFCKKVEKWYFGFVRDYLAILPIKSRFDFTDIQLTIEE